MDLQTSLCKGEGKKIKSSLLGFAVFLYFPVLNLGLWLDYTLIKQSIQEEEKGTLMKWTIMVQHILHEGIVISKSCFVSLTPWYFFASVQNNCCGIKLKAILCRYNSEIFNP